MSDIQAAYVGNCAAGTVTGQESIRGQVILSSIGLGRFPLSILKMPVAAPALPSTRRP